MEILNKMEKQKIKLTLYLSKETIRKIKHKNIDTGLNMSRLVEKLLTDYLEI